MGNLLTLNAAKLLGPPTVTWSVATSSGSITASYAVGTWLSGTFTPYSGGTGAHVVSISLSATDVVSDRLAAMAAAIATQENLQVAAAGGTDVIFNENGEQIA